MLECYDTRKLANQRAAHKAPVGRHYALSVELMENYNNNIDMLLFNLV